MQLTPAGRQWCQTAFGQAPVESEIAVTAAGCAVETQPGAVLAAEDEPWHARAEPDLAFTLRG